MIEDKQRERSMTDKLKLLELTADIVAAFVGNNAVAANDLPGIIRDVHTALLSTDSAAAELDRPEPAVAVKRSVGRDHITCLEDGRKFKSLKRHLRTGHGMTPQEYRERWGLPAHYPMVAPDYARARSELAKNMGLGQKGRRKRK
jgi:predicted transcriptional regulator